MNTKLKIGLSLILLSTATSFSFEVNTHQAITRCATQYIQGLQLNQCAKHGAVNLHKFAENSLLDKESYDQEMFGAYGETYFKYAKKGKGFENWNILISNKGYQGLIEAGVVLDTGNNRVQVFNHVGAYLADIDGSSTAEGKLSSPLNMIGSSSMIISDAGNNMIRELNYNEITKGESGKKLLTGTFGKVTYSSDGLLVSDNGNKQFTFFNITGDIQKQLPTTSTNLIALSYENYHQLLQVKNDGNLEHIYIPKTVPSASPKALAEKFVKAYLDGDDVTMLSLTSKSNIDKLKKIDTKVKEAFNGMTSYDERIYMNGLRAVVNGKTTVSVGKVSIKFYFNWTHNKWSLIEVI